jgi:hypothetical protein
VASGTIDVADDRVRLEVALPFFVGSTRGKNTAADQKQGGSLWPACETVIFNNTITRGFAAIGDPKVAVCLLPGTEIAFEKEVEYDGWLPFFRRKAGAKIARFR